MSFYRRCLEHQAELDGPDGLTCPAGHRAEQHHPGTDRMEPAFEVYDSARDVILWEVHGDSIRDRFERQNQQRVPKLANRDADGISDSLRLSKEQAGDGRRVYRERILEQVCAGCGAVCERLSRHQRRKWKCRGLGPA